MSEHEMSIILDDKYGVTRDKYSFVLYRKFYSEKQKKHIWTNPLYYPTIESLCVKLLDLKIFTSESLTLLKIGDLVENCKSNYFKLKKHKFVKQAKRKRKNFC
jgi:hypothetical protein